MLLIVHIVVSIMSVIAASFVYVKQTKITKIVARPSIILSTTAGSVVTGLILVTQGSSVIRVCAFGIALSTFAIFSIIKSVKNNQLIIDL